jgi:hypothetical protein
MSKTPIRVVKTFRYAVFCNGVNAYVVIEPFTVYGWSEITIEEWIYPFHPKANTMWTKFSMIGDMWNDLPSTQHETDNRYDYTYVATGWNVRRPDGTRRWYGYNFFAWRTTWVHLIRRFTQDREFSVWVNAERRYSATVLAEEKTVLEWNPDTATYPERYRRFVLGANTQFSEYMKVYYYTFRIYSRALEDWEIEHNFRYPYNPVRDGLELYLLAHPDCIADVDGDGVLEWIDLSGKNRHAKIYNAQLVELVRQPVRVLARAR